MKCDALQPFHALFILRSTDDTVKCKHLSLTVPREATLPFAALHSSMRSDVMKRKQNEPCHDDGAALEHDEELFPARSCNVLKDWKQEYWKQVQVGTTGFLLYR